jgi:hypothetical protein
MKWHKNVLKKNQREAQKHVSNKMSSMNHRYMSAKTKSKLELTFSKPSFSLLIDP